MMDMPTISLAVHVELKTLALNTLHVSWTSLTYVVSSRHTDLF